MPHLPAAGELVLFNRSWYNRAGVEIVMGFSSNCEHQDFMRDVTAFETSLKNTDIQLFKYYLDTSKAEQKRRLAARGHDIAIHRQGGPNDR